MTRGDHKLSATPDFAQLSLLAGVSAERVLTCICADFASTAWRQRTTWFVVTYGYQVCEIGAHDPWGS
jgi:hypothetical protein